MSSSPEKLKGAKRPAAGKRLESLRTAANAFIVGHYPIGMLAGVPRRLRIQRRDLWIVPVVVTSPGLGAVGEAGFVALDAITLEVIGSTPRPEVEVSASHFREVRREAIEAAFLQARKTQ